MFNIFNKSKEIKGEIGYFKLQDWWITTFSEAERKHIEEVFQPLGLNSQEKPLTEGDISYSSGTASGLLNALAGWFNRPNERHIAIRLINKAFEEALKSKNIIDLHFTLQQMMEIYYRERDTQPEAFDKAVWACKEQISIAPEVAKAFLMQYPKQPLPAHARYEQLRIILKKQGKYNEAINICMQAKQQGWCGNWDKQIQDLKKR